jgi:hypothetical protein
MQKITKAEIDSDKMMRLYVTERIAKCSENLKAKNPEISPETVTGLCETVNGILKSPDKREIPGKLDSLLHEWFKESSLIEEILKTINSKDLCFLHSVSYDFVKNRFYLIKHYGRNNEAVEEINFKTYYTNQIEKCESNLMAINFGYNLQDSGHATMVVIERGKLRDDGKQLIEVEHFDSSNIEEEQMKATLEKFIKSLFGEDKFYFKFHHQDEVCDFNIQCMFFENSPNLFGCCTQFALWYAFKRLLEPDKSRDEVIADMTHLLYTNDPDTVMMILIKQFQSLISIKTSEKDKFQIEANGRNLYWTSKSYESLTYQEMAKEYEDKLKKYEDLLDRLLESKNETEYNDADNMEDELRDLRFFIMSKVRNWPGEHLETKRRQLEIKKQETDYNHLFNNGFKPFREKLEQYEDALSRCKMSSSKEACELADRLQVLSGDDVDTAKIEVIKGKPPLIKNKAIADLVAKYERLFQEHKEMKNPKTVFRHRPATGSNVARLAAMYEKKGGRNTKRKKLQRRRQKSAKKRV